MTPTTYGRDFAYCLKSHGGVRGFNASLWRFLLRCTLFCHSVATFLTSVSSYEGGCGFEVYEIIRRLLCQLVVRTEHVKDFVLIQFFHVVASRTKILTWVKFCRFFSKSLADSSSHSQTRV